MARSAHPSEYGKEYQDALRVGRERFPRMQFENEAEKSDYMRRVRNNDNNVPGLPSICLFPPDEIIGWVPDKSARECKVEGCGGCCIYIDHYVCPRCGTDNSREVAP